MTNHPPNPYLDTNRHDWIVHTELCLQAVEHAYPFPSLDVPEWTMWLDKEDFPEVTEGPLHLQPVETPEQWERLHHVRIQIEQADNAQHQALTRQLIEDAQTKTARFGGQWFLAMVGGRDVGQIGLVPFTWNRQRIGRLQNVDIIPTEQGKQYGHQLLLQLCQEARRQQLDALCLMALSNNWPRLWYQRFGFVKQGEHHTPTLRIANLRDHIKDTVQQHFPHHTMILYGSWARAQATKESDVDLFCIGDNGEYHQRTLYKDERLLDAWCTSVDAMPDPKDLLHLSSGIVLYQRNDEGTKLMSAINKALEQPPPPMPIWKQETYRQWTQKMLRRSRRNDPEGDFRRHWLLFDSLSLWFSLRQIHYPGPKAAVHWLQRNEPITHKAFCQAMTPGASLEDIEAWITKVIASSELRL